MIGERPAVDPSVHHRGRGLHGPARVELPQQDGILDRPRRARGPGVSCASPEAGPFLWHVDRDSAACDEGDRGEGDGA